MSGSLVSPRQVAKLAHIAVSLDRDKGFFLPWVVGVPYRAEQHAVCGHGHRHPVPDPGCSCGFYAANNVETLFDLLEPTIEHLAGAALLDAEFGGVELAGPDGVRAAQQRVLAAGLFRWCRPCAAQDRIPDGPPALYTPPSAPYGRDQRTVQVLCDRHAAGATDAREITFADLSGLLRTEVRWASASVHEGFLARHERRLFDFSERAPLLPDRRAGELRMGQRGFLSGSAVRFDAPSRTLRVDLDARAPQRPLYRPFVALKRTVHLGWELRIPAEHAEELDACLSAACSAPSGTNEEVVSAVRGLLHLPSFASALSQ